MGSPPHPLPSPSSPLPILSHPPSPKVKTLIIEDFLTYPASFLQDLSGAEACIWYSIPLPARTKAISMTIVNKTRALGGIPSRFPDLATARKVNIDYAFVAAKVFVETLSPQLGPDKKFRFLYVSGHAVDRDLSKQHRFFNDAVHIKVSLLFSSIS